MEETYKVKTGDNLWKIAKEHGISLDELIKLNPTKKNVIYTGDVLRLKPTVVKESVNIREERKRENELNLENISAIQGYRHDSNYVIVDKPNRTLTIYDKDNRPLYQTSEISFGASGNDYNTITYVDKNGKIVNKKGNNSTPAGITTITGKGMYHGFPSFTRGRVDNKGESEDIASSFHWGNTAGNKHASNGCVRVNGKCLAEMEPLLSSGTRVYTLPEKEGSRFTLKGGKLNFTADNPYGNDSGNKRFWDDYNVTIDKSYAPLKLKWNKTGNKEYDDNRKQFAQSLVNNKKDIQQRFNLSSDEYNRLVDLALGIAEQESRFGTADSYKAKQSLGESRVTYLKGLQAKLKPKGGRDITKGWNTIGVLDYLSKHLNPFNFVQDEINTYNVGKTKAMSRGFTQIKNKSDNKELQEIYKNLNIDDNTIKTPQGSALATIARLANIYNNEIKGRNFKDANGNRLDPYHALMYKWLGKHKEITNGTATPSKNNYIRNVNNYSRNFDMYEDREYNVYKLGGRITLENN